MHELFARNAAWKILWHFATHPSSEVYVNEAARKLGLSPGSCSRRFRELESLGLLERRKLGRAHYYRLSENFLTAGLKRFTGLFQLHGARLVERLREWIPGLSSIALYGSFAQGDFSETSDIDLLVLAPTKTRVDLSDLEAELDHEINIVTYSVGGWLKLKAEGNGFYSTVMRNHRLLYGGELP